MAKVNNGGMIAKTQNTAVAARREPRNIKEWIGAYKDQFAKALPSAITPERFTRMAVSAVSQNEKLAECTTESFLGALMNAAQLGLEPNTPLGQAYLIPYYNGRTRCMECQFQIGYRGMIDLAYRSGEVSMLQAHVVHENDFFEFEYGLDPMLKHRPNSEERGRATYVYAVFKLVNGGVGFQVMSIEDIRMHAMQYSKSVDRNTGEKVLGNVWRTNFDAMAKKTVLKALLKYAPLTSEFARGISSDETTQIIEMPANPGEDMKIIVQDSHVITDTTAAPESSDVPWPEEAPPEK